MGGVRSFGCKKVVKVMNDEFLLSSQSVEENLVSCSVPKTDFGEALVKFRKLGGNTRTSEVRINNR